MAKPKLKSAAQLAVPQSKDEAAAYIKKIGDLLRQKLRNEANMNDAIANITASYQPEIEILQAEVNQLQEGVQAYCEAHRDELTQNGKSKSANLITGEVMWRQKPPSVRVSKVDAVIDMLKRLGLAKFVRTKEELNKDAILNEPEAVRGVAGLSIVSGTEQFEINPFEQEAA